MASTTANAIGTAALQSLGVIDPEETPTAAMLHDAFLRVNKMLGSWSVQYGTIPVIAREIFDLDADKGGPGDPYTIGPGGDFDTARPNELEGAGLLLGASDPEVEIPLAIVTNDGFQLTQIKELFNVQPTQVYYKPTFAAGLGTIILWPVPTVDTNRLVLYLLKPLIRFTSQIATYYLPDAAEEAIEYQLALRLAPTWNQGNVPQDVRDIARSAFGIYKRSNNKLVDLAQDIPNGNRRYGYNIMTGTG